MLTDPQNCDSKFQAVNQTRSKIKFEYPEAGSWSTVSQEQFSLKIPEETPMGNLNSYKRIFTIYKQ